MVKIYDAVDSGIDITYFNEPGNRGIIQIGTNYLVATFSENNLYIKKYNSSFVYQSDVYSYSFGDTAVRVAVFLTIIGSTYYLIAGYQYIDGAAKNRIIYTTSADGNTWAAETTRIYTDGCATTNLDYIEFVYVNSKYWLIIGSSETVYIYEKDAGTVFKDVATASDTSDGTYTVAHTRGFVDTNYYFLRQRYLIAAPHTISYNILSFNGTTIAIDSSPSLTSTDIIEVEYSFFWKQTDIILGWKNTLWYYTSSTWYFIAETTGTYPCPLWEIDTNLLISGVVYTNRYFHIENGVFYVFRLSNSYDCVWGWENLFVSTSYNVYNIQLTATTKLLELKPTHIVEQAPIAILKSTDTYLPNEYMEFYDDLDTLIHAGEAKNITTQNGISEGTVKSLLDIDLDREITYTGSAETIATLFSNIITTYFKYGSAGTLTSAATTYNWNFQTRKIRDIFSEAAHIEGRVWYSTITLVIQLNAGTIDSTKTFKSSDGKYPASISKTTNNQKIGVVTGYGAAGISYTYTKDASNGLITLHLPSLTLTELTAYVTKYADLENATQTQYTLTYLFGLLPLQVGQQLTFEYVLGDHNVASALMYIKEIEYDALDNYILKIVLHDVMIFKKSALTTQQCFAYTREVDAAKLDTTTAASTYVALTGDQTIAGVKTFSSLKSENNGDFKGAYALQWGTSGTPTGITNTFNNISIATYQSHIASLVLISSATDQTAYNTIAANLTTGYVSFWIAFAQTNDNGYVLLRNATDSNIIGAIGINADGNLYALNSGLSTKATLVSGYSSAVWYHVCIYHQKGVSLTWYINNQLIYTQTDVGDYILNYIMPYSNDADITIYWDALYTGTSLDEAMNSLHDGQIQAKGFYDLTKQSPLGLTYFPLDYMDNSNSVTIELHSATNLDTIDLDLVNGSYANKSAGITIDFDNLALFEIPNNAKAVQIEGTTWFITTANTGNGIEVQRYGNSNWRHGLRIRCGSTASYITISQAPVMLNDGKIQLRMRVGAGTVYADLRVIGFYV